MNNTPGTKPEGPLSIRELETQPRPRSPDEVREAREQAAAQGLRRGRQRRAIGRTEPISVKTFPRIKKLIIDMADAEGKSFTEIIEDAVERRHAELKGTKP